MSPEIIVPGKKVKIVSDNRADRTEVVRFEGTVVERLAKFIRVRVDTPTGEMFRNVSARSLRPA